MNNKQSSTSATDNLQGNIVDQLHDDNLGVSPVFNKTGNKKITNRIPYDDSIWLNVT